jgi:hypothetical protein
MTSLFLYLFALLVALVVVLVVLTWLLAKEKAQHAADSARHLQARRNRSEPPDA